MAERNDVYLGQADDIEIQELVSKIERNIRSYMNKRDIVLKEGERVNMATPPFSIGNGMPTREMMKHHYEKLLGGKIDDEGMREQVIKYAEIMLQERTWCTIQMQTDKGGNAVIKVVCCLPEHGQAFVNYWAKQEIDVTTFPRQVEEFSRSMRGLKVATALVKESPSKGGKVIGIQTYFHMQ